MVYGQNGMGHNGTDKMVRTKWYMDKMVYGQNGMDEMVWTEWHGHNGSNFGIDYNLSEFNTYLVTKSRK